MFFFLTLHLGCASWNQSACVDHSDRNALLEIYKQDNQVYLDQRSENSSQSSQLAWKFQKMATSEYDFMRGSLQVFWSQLQHENLESEFLQEPQSQWIPIYGDAHPENYAMVFQPSTQSGSLEIVDLDSAHFAPWTWEVRRALLSIRVFASMFEGCSDKCQAQLVDAWLQGFEAGLKTGSMDWSQSQILQDLYQEAIEEGAERKRFWKFMDREARKPQLQRRTVNDEGKGLQDVSDPSIRELMVQWAFQTEKENVRILDLVEQLGKGVSSLPAKRYLILWDQGEDSTPEILMFRQIFPLQQALTMFQEPVQRLSKLQPLLLQNASFLEMHALKQGSRYFKTQKVTSYMQDIDVSKLQEDFQEGDYQIADLQKLSQVLGMKIGAQCHHSQTQNGSSCNTVVLADIEKAGGWAHLKAVSQTLAKNDQQEHVQNYRWFQWRLSQTDGLLGL